MLILLNFYNKSRFILLLLISYTFLYGCGSDNKVTIAENVNQNIANSVLLLLSQNHINANLVVQKDLSYNIIITQKDQLNALQILKDNGQPMEKFVTLGDVFKKDGLISSPIEEQGRLTYALNQQISSMLSQFDGVISVDAQVSLPAPSDSLWSNVVAKPSASVLIKQKHGYHLDLYIDKIKHLVSNAVPGLTSDMVEVVILS